VYVPEVGEFQPSSYESTQMSVTSINDWVETDTYYSNLQITSPISVKSEEDCEKLVYDINRFQYLESIYTSQWFSGNFTGGYELRYVLVMGQFVVYYKDHTLCNFSKSEICGLFNITMVGPYVEELDDVYNVYTIKYNSENYFNVYCNGFYIDWKQHDAYKLGYQEIDKCTQDLLEITILDPYYMKHCLNYVRGNKYRFLTIHKDKESIISVITKALTILGVTLMLTRGIRSFSDKSIHTIEPKIVELISMRKVTSVA